MIFRKFLIWLNTKNKCLHINSLSFTPIKCWPGKHFWTWSLFLIWAIIVRKYLNQIFGYKWMVEYNTPLGHLILHHWNIFLENIQIRNLCPACKTQHINWDMYNEFYTMLTALKNVSKKNSFMRIIITCNELIEDQTITTKQIELPTNESSCWK